MTKNLQKNKIPMRKCIGCSESKPQTELDRIAYYEEELTVDKTGRAKGRGVYLCKNETCRENALKRGAFQRAFKKNFDKDILENIVKEIADGK